MATVAWDRIRAGIGVASARQDEGLRRVGTRLALQTVGLLFVMLIVLEVVVYVRTKQAFLGTLRHALTQRTSQLDGTACTMLQIPCNFRNGFGSFPGQQGPLRVGSSDGSSRH